MSDLDPVPPTAAVEPPNPAPADPVAVPDKPKKKPGVIRWGGVITILVLVALVVLAIPLGLEPWLVKKVKDVLRSQGLELAPQTTLGISLFGGRLHAEQLELHEVGKSASVAYAVRLDADVAMWETLVSGDIVIAELTLEGLSGNLRRGPRGEVPVVTPPAEPGHDWSQVDWMTYAKKGLEKLKERRDAEQKKQAEKQPAPSATGAQPTPGTPPLVQDAPDDWPKSKTWRQAQRDEKRWSRVVVRHLLVSFAKVSLPDESPLDVTGGKLEGRNVALRQDAGEGMTLVGELTTLGAGPLALDLARNPDETGHLIIKAPTFPLALLADQRIAGDSLAPYGPTGSADLVLPLTWKDWDLAGTMTATVTGLKLTPTAAAGGEAQKVATYVNALKGQPITWPVTFGGVLYAPTITDSGVDEVLKGGVKDAAVNYAKDKAGAEADKQLKKLEDKNPAAKQATDGLKNLFGK